MVPESTPTTPWRIGSLLAPVLYGSAILYFGREILVPIAFAGLISFVLFPFCAWLEKKRLGRMSAVVVAMTTLMVFFILITTILALQLMWFAKEWPALLEKAKAAMSSLGNFAVNGLGFSVQQWDQWRSSIINEVGSGIPDLLSRVVSLSSFSIIMMLLIPVYVVLILYYRSIWVEVLFRLWPGTRRESIKEILLESVHSYYQFVKGVGLVYLIVGILNSIGLYFLGVPNPLLFGFIASVLTFIPYVGIIVGSLLPVTLAWMTHDSMWYPLGVIGLFAVVQYLEANIIFPMAVSNRMNVNTLAVLVAIFLGALLWGVAGMILFVPFVGILKLIADRDPGLETLALALGTKSPPKVT